MLPSLLGKDAIGLISAYFEILYESGEFWPDPQAGAAMSCYGAPALDALLMHLREPIEAIAGVALLPTYSFVRTYGRGSVLQRHRDRAACEHSLTLHVQSSGEAWPIMFERIDGEIVALELDPGDAVMYRGIEIPHWREPCPVESYRQVFLHWVERDGSHADQVFDGRERLGAAAVAPAALVR